MTKAEQTAVEKYPHGIFDGELGDSLRAACAVGYMQAQKDLALTWEDIKFIIQTFLKSISDAESITSNKAYKETLKRFNEQRKK